MAGFSGPAGTNQGSWNGNGGSLGLTTGATWKGNTAFGPSGGMASGYATRDPRSLNAAGSKPTMGSYSNFNNMSGNPMFGGLLGNQQFQGMNAMQAYGAAQNAYNAMNTVQQSPLNRPTTQGRPVPVSDIPPPPVQPINAIPQGYYPASYWGTPTQQPYNPALSPGYEAYTSVYKPGPASPFTGETTINQNNLGNFGGYFKR